MLEFQDLSHSDPSRSNCAWQRGPRQPSPDLDLFTLDHNYLNLN
jgi:hypothetical protein